MAVIDHLVTSVREGDQVMLANGILKYSPARLRDLAASDERIADIQIHTVNKNDQTRLVHVLDCMTPASKSDGGPGVFPGILCPVETINDHDTRRLRGVLVTAVGELAHGDAFLRQEEAVIDMQADCSPLANTCHVVLEFSFPDDLGNDERELALRRALALAAEELGKAPIDDGAESPPESAGGREPKRLVHICEVATFGQLFDTWLLGGSMRDTLPTVVTPQNLADGWVVSAEHHYAAQRNWTCFYQDNPVVRAVNRPGTDATLEGVILLPTAHSHLEKERHAAIAANGAVAAGADGVVVTATAAGNAHLDVMFAVRACERLGIGAVAVLVELAGEDGRDPGLTDWLPEADLLISTGNREEKVEVPSCTTILGGTEPLNQDDNELFRKNAQTTAALCVMAGANSQLGASHLTCQEW